MTDEYEILDSGEAGGRAIRGGLIRTTAFAGGLLLGLVSAPLVVRHLGSEDFGRYASVLAVVAIVTGLTEGGINTVTMRELAGARTPQQRDRAMRDLLGLRMVLSAVGAAGAVAFSAIVGYGPELVLGTALAALGMVLSALQSLFAAVLEARLRFGLASIVDFARGVLTTVLIVLLVVLEAGLLAFLAIVIPAAALGLGLTVVLLRGTLPLRPAFHPSWWLPMLRETSVFAVAVAVNSMYFRLTLVVLSLLVTAKETGYFAVSFRVMEVLVGIPVILLGAAFPILSRTANTDRPRFDAVAGRLFELALMTGVMISLATTLAAPFIIEVLTGSPDDPATDVLRIQSLAMMASFAAGAAGYPLLSLGRHRETLAANVGSLVVVLVLCLSLAPSLGAQGGAIAAVVADMVLATANVAFLIRDGGPRLPLVAVPQILGAGMVGYGAGQSLGVHPLVESAVGVAAFLVALIAMRRFPPEVREIVLHRRAPEIMQA